MKDLISIHFQENSCFQTLDPENWTKKYFKLFYYYAKKRTSDHQTAEDIVQETFLSGLKTIHHYKGWTSEHTWLMTILKRRIIDYYRSKNTEKSRKVIIESKLFNTYNCEYSWLEQYASNLNFNNGLLKLENENLKLEIKRSIQRLPKKQLQVFYLKKIKGYSTEAICNKLNLSADYTWVLLHRAKKNLQYELIKFLD